LASATTSGSGRGGAGGSGATVLPAAALRSASLRSASLRSAAANTVGEAEEIPLFFTLIPVLALLSNYDRENCLINVGTEGELRIQHAGEPYRVLYAFDPKRRAVLLLGGIKTGDDRWYEIHVPIADRIYRKYLAEMERG
jgi:hypothetical protein